MKKFIIFYIILTFFMMIGVTFAHHANEKYCFNCNHKYKIGDKENDTYEFEFDLQNTILLNYRNSIGRVQTKDLSEVVEEKVSLSDRFGMILGFYPFSQDQYLEMVINYKNTYKIPISDEETIKEAIEWQQTRGGRSGRVAWQFILELAGKFEVIIQY